MIAMGGAMAHAETKPAAKDIVIVHGALVDGSGWRAVYDILSKDGFHVTIVQEPLTGLAEDVDATKRVIDQQTGPVVLVGHSYGGSVITDAGADPKVSALVYVAALQPDVGGGQRQASVEVRRAKRCHAGGQESGHSGQVFLHPAGEIP